eukprot:Partr_v1_DN27352_c1_g1_i2_m45888 putative Component of the SCF(sconB) E3 ubiquitin ligase complex involved in the regulation of sulfur metabolite repression, probably by mediating the inactivation or degradation of the metR transcription factor
MEQSRSLPAYQQDELVLDQMISHNQTVGSEGYRIAALVDDKTESIIEPDETTDNDIIAKSFGKSSLSTLLASALEDIDVDMDDTKPLFFSRAPSLSNIGDQLIVDTELESINETPIEHHQDSDMVDMIGAFQGWPDSRRDVFLQALLPCLRVGQLNLLSSHLIPHILPHLSSKALTSYYHRGEPLDASHVAESQESLIARKSVDFLLRLASSTKPTSDGGTKVDEKIKNMENFIINRSDTLKWLPAELSLKILQQLDPISLGRCSSVSRKWRHLSTTEILWKPIFVNRRWSWGVTDAVLCQVETQVEEVKRMFVERRRRKVFDIESNLALAIGRIWKFAFRERYRIRRNWELGNCSVRTFEGHTEGVTCLQFNEHFIASGSSDCTLKFWALRTNTHPLLTLKGHSGTIRCLQFDSKKLISGSNDRTLRIWDIEENSAHYGTCIGVLNGHTGPVRCLQMGSISDSWLDSFHDADEEFNQTDIQNGTVQNCLLVSGSYDCSIKIWQLYIWSSHGRPIEDRSFHICRRTLVGHLGAVVSLQFDLSDDQADDRKLVSGSADCTIRLWNFHTGECLRVFQGHTNTVSCLQFDSYKIVSGSLDSSVKFWRIDTGSCEQTIDWVRSEGHKGVVRNLKFDQWLMITSSDDKTLKVWELFDRNSLSGEFGSGNSWLSQVGIVGGLKRMLTLKRHNDGVTCVQFDYKMIVSGSYDKTIKVWDFSAP